MDVNSDKQVDGYLDKTTRILSQALKFQPGNENEIFQILIHISPQIGHLIPLDYDVSSSITELSFNERNQHEDFDFDNQSHLNHIKHITVTLTSYYVNKIKTILSCNAGNDHSNLQPQLTIGQINGVCHCLEKIRVLSGDKQAVDKFRSIVSICMDMLLQQRLTYVQNAISNLPQLKQNFVGIGADAKLLISSVIQILTCTNILKEKSQQIEFIQDTILEKLSLELLTLADSMKDGLTKLSSKSKPDKQDHSMGKQKTKFSTSISCDDIYLSTETISDFASIVGVFLSLEESIQTSSTLDILDSGSNARHKKGVLKNNSLELPDLIRSSQHHSAMLRSVSSVGRWDWCETLRELTPFLSSSMLYCFHEMMATLLHEAKEKCRLVDGSHLNTVSSTSSKLNIKQYDCPKIVLKCVGEMLDLVIKWLPLGILGGKYRHMTKLHTDFLDVINQALKDIKPFLMTVIEDIPEKTTPACLPNLLSTTADIVIVLHYCGQKMQQDNRLPFNGTVQLYKSLCNQLHQHIIQYHYNKIVTGLFHDSESNYWSDPREFFEGERCSYSIEMWQMHMCKLSEDLHAVAADVTAKSIIAEIFSKTISVLANRYCSCLPSYNRHKQVRMDIAKILLFSFDFMWTIIPEPFLICPRKDLSYSTSSDDLISKIHTACIDLFTCVHILAAPLSDLYAAVGRMDVQNTPMFEWLTVMHSSLFPVGWNGKSSSLSDAAYIVCLIKHIIHNPDKQVSLTLQALTTRQCYLSKKMLRGELMRKETNQMMVHHYLLTSPLKHSVNFSRLFVECAKVSVNYSSKQFCSLQFLEEEHEENKLPWQSTMYKLIMPQMAKVMSAAVNFLVSHSWSLVGREICGSLPTKIRELIPTVQDDMDILLMCTTMVLQKLKIFALRLPEPVVSLLVNIDRLVEEDHVDVKLLCGTYGSHILLHAANLSLLKPDYLANQLGINISGEVAAGLKRVAQMLLIFDDLEGLYSNEESEGSSYLIGAIKSFHRCSSQIFSHTNSYNDEILDFDIFSMHGMNDANDLDPDARASITQLSHMLCDNYLNISKQLGFDLTSKDGKGGLSETADGLFSQSWDWKPSLLYCLASRPNDVQTYLLQKRPEMQENAFLTDQEKDQVEFLRSYFNLQTPD